MPCRRYAVGAAMMLALGALLLAPSALALPAPVGTEVGRAARVAVAGGHEKQSSAPCGVAVPVIGGIVSEVTGGVCAAAGEAVGAVAGLAGEAASAVGDGILGLLARWMIGAARQVTTFVSSEMRDTTTPQLETAWYEAQFQPMADLGAALGLLVALVALGSAAIRRSPQALAATIAGIARAGIGTGLVVAMTATGLGVADEISGAVLSGSPHAFWASVAHAWGTGGFGGFGSSALAMLIALVEVFAAVFVWLELIVRGAAIYVAVLFLPVALAAAIWPALSAWPGRLGRLLGLLVILKPVALIVLSLAGNAAAAGLSFGGGVSGSVGTILAATVIYGMAAFAPWALMYLLAADAESAYAAAGMRAAAGAAVLDEGSRSVRSAGGLRSLAGNGSAGGMGGAGPAGAGPSPNGGGGDAGPSPGGPSGMGADGSASGAEDDGTLPVGAEAIGAGSIGVAAGVGARAGRTGEDTEEPGGSSEGRGGSVGEGAGAGVTGAAGAGVGSSPPGGGRVISLPGAGRASEGALSERSDGGVTGPGVASDEPGPGPPAPGSRSPEGGGELPHDGATETLARSPRRRARPRPSWLTAVPSSPGVPSEPKKGEG